MSRSSPQYLIKAIDYPIARPSRRIEGKERWLYEEVDGWALTPSESEWALSGPHEFQVAWTSGLAKYDAIEILLSKSHLLNYNSWKQKSLWLTQWLHLVTQTLNRSTRTLRLYGNDLIWIRRVQSTSEIFGSCTLLIWPSLCPHGNLYSCDTLALLSEYFTTPLRSLLPSYRANFGRFPWPL